MYVRWCDKKEDFSFDVTHLLGSRNPTDPLSRCGFADGNRPAESTGDTDAESRQELCSLMGRNYPASAMLAAIRTRWAATRREAAATFVKVQEGDATPSAPPREGALPPPCHSMFIALAGAELSLRLGTGTTIPPSQVPSDDFFVSPTFVQNLVAELAVQYESTRFLGPFCAARRWRLAVSLTSSSGPSPGPPAHRRAGRCWCVAAMLYCRGQGSADRLCIRAGGRLRAP